MVIEKVKMVHPGLSYGWHSSSSASTPSSSSASQSAPPAAHSREAFLPASTFSFPPAGWILWGGGGGGGGRGGKDDDGDEIDGDEGGVRCQYLFTRVGGRRISSRCCIEIGVSESVST